MTLSLGQLGFYLGFLSGVILLLLLGGSALQPYLFLGWSIILMYRCFSTKWHEVLQYKNILLLWLLFLVTQIIATYVSHTLPLSLTTLSVNIFAFSLFFTILIAKPSPPEREFLLWGFIQIGVVLVLLGFIFFLFPSFSTLLPGMNLLYASYGHNHMAIYLLLVIPLAWWLTQKLNSRLAVLIPVVLSLGLLMSFGRTAIVIGLMELLVIAWQTRKIKTFDSLVRKWILMVFGVAVAVQVAVSLSPVLWQKQICLFPAYKSQLCKSITNEPRILYWQQAVSAIKQYPVLGYGPGTFTLINRLYRQSPEINTSYAHNAFLEQFAETGVLGGGAFLSLMGYLLWVASRKTTRPQLLSQTTALLLSLGAVYLNVLFDFDWNFVGIFAITLIFLALLIGQTDEPKPATNQLKQKRLYPIINGSLVASWLFLLMWAVLRGVTDYLIAIGQPQTAFKIFPYFYSQLPVFEKSTQLDESDRAILYHIYRYDPDHHHSLLASEDNPQHTVKLIKQLYKIDPWQQRYQNNLAYFIDQKDVLAADQEAQQLIGFYRRQQPPVDNYFLEYEQKKHFATQLATIGDMYLEQHNYQKSGEYYRDAQSFDSWLFVYHQPPLDLLKISVSDLHQFLEPQQEIPAEYFSEAQPLYVEAYMMIFQSTLSQRQFEGTLPLIRRLIELAPEKEWEIWHTSSEVLLPILKESVHVQDWSQAEHAAQVLQQIRSELPTAAGMLDAPTETLFAQLLAELTKNSKI